MCYNLPDKLMKKTKHFFSKHPIIYSSIIVIILIIGGFITFRGNNTDLETVTITKTTFKRQVSVSGKVVAAQSADLGFEQGGRLGSIQAPIGTFVKKGATIASLENGDIHAELLQKEAALEREQAKLTSLIQGTRSEQLTIDQRSYDDATRAYVVAMRTAKIDTELTLLEDVNTLFENGSGVNPDILINLSSIEKEQDIEHERLLITEKISALSKSLALLKEPYNEKSIRDAGNLTTESLNFTNNFLNHLITAIENSGLSQSDVDTYRSTINRAGQEVAAALNVAQAAELTWNSKLGSLTLSKAGTTAADISAQNASVKAARADVESAQARFRKTLIVAPFDGTVTRMDIKVGEIIASNSSQISLMSTNSFNIESFVPEIHIAYIQPGNIASVILDAYDSESAFGAKVISIDPAETIRDGVSTYKVTLSFDQNDSRIKSGMTGSIIITTLEIPDSIVIPQSSVEKRGDQSYVYKIVDGVPTETSVVIGNTTSLGQIEIRDGLDVGDIIAATVPKK